MSARHEEIRENLEAVQQRILAAATAAGRGVDEITLIAVSKFFPIEDAQSLYELGIRDFGENRDDEGASKSVLLPTDARWHFQGQIQSRKISSIMGWADSIHSLDSLEHAAKCERALIELGENREFFIQINLEPQRRDRGGIALDELPQFLQSTEKFSQVRPVGVMAVLPIAADPRHSFETIATAASRCGLSKLSLGMSGDFEEAIASGATHIRVGSSILGSRPTPA